jgi:hypothetical protein
MAKELINIKMGISMKASGKKEKSMVKVPLYMLMEVNI